MTQTGGSDRLLKISAWLIVNLVCLSFWSATYSLVAAEYSYGLKMPPTKYLYTPKIKPIVVYVRQRQTNKLCRNKETAAKVKRGWQFIGCAMEIVAGRDKGRHLVYVATDSSVPKSVILRHEYGHVNGWRH